MSDNKREARRQTKKFMAGFGILFMVIGGLASVHALYEITQGILSNNWPSVKGRVVQSEISKHEHIDRNVGSGVTRNVSYRPNVVYEYQIDGDRYRNDKIAFAGTGGTDINRSRRYTNRFPAGKEVRVYYSPFDAQNSVLIKSYSKLSIGGLVGALLFFGFGMLFYKLRNFYARSIPD